VKCTGIVLVGLAMLMSASIVECGDGPGSSRAVAVRGQFVCSTGAPYGGCFALLAVPTGRLLASGRIDNLGDLRASVSVAEGEHSVTLVADASDMLRNAVDDPGPPGEFPEKIRLLDEWWSPRFDGTGIQVPEDVVAKIGEHDQGIIVGASGYRAVEVVTATQEVGSGGAIDFGKLRFRTVRPAMEVIVDLVTPDGMPLHEGMLLSGYRDDPHRPGGNVVYPHMALAQRGAVLRILLTNAAWRLLVNSPDDTLAIASIGDMGVPHRIGFSSVERKQIMSHSRELRIKVSPTFGRPAGVTLLRPSPEEPKLWWLGEPSFRWQ